MSAGIGKTEVTRTCNQVVHLRNVEVHQTEGRMAEIVFHDCKMRDWEEVNEMMKRLYESPTDREIVKELISDLDLKNLFLASIIK